MMNLLIPAIRRRPVLLSIPLFTLATIGFSVLYTWLWNFTGGSLLVVCLFHAFYNNLNLLASTPYPYIIDQHWIYMSVLAAVLAVLLLGAGRSLSQQQEDKEFERIAAGVTRQIS